MSKFRPSIGQWQKDKTLLRLQLQYQGKETRNVSGRIIAFDEKEDRITLYLDDRKSYLHIYLRHIMNMEMLPIYELVNVWVKDNSLLQVRFTQARRGTRSLFGRIIQMDENTGNLIFYDVDAKMVNNIALNELDDIREENKSLTAISEKWLRDMNNQKDIPTHTVPGEPPPPKPESSLSAAEAAAKAEAQRAAELAAEAAKAAAKAAEAAKQAEMAKAAEAAKQAEEQKKAEAAKAAEEAAKAAAAKNPPKGNDPRGSAAADIISQKGHLKSGEADDVEIDMSHLSVKEEMIILLEKLTPQDIYPLLPLMRYLVKEAKKRDQKKK